MYQTITNHRLAQLSSVLHSIIDPIDWASLNYEATKISRGIPLRNNELVRQLLLRPNELMSRQSLLKGDAANLKPLISAMPEDLKDLLIMSLCDNDVSSVFNLLMLYKIYEDTFNELISKVESLRVIMDSNVVDIIQNLIPPIDDSKPMHFLMSEDDEFLTQLKTNCPELIDEQLIPYKPTISERLENVHNEFHALLNRMFMSKSDSAPHLTEMETTFLNNVSKFNTVHGTKLLVDFDQLYSGTTDSLYSVTVCNVIDSQGLKKLYLDNLNLSSGVRIVPITYNDK